MSPLDDTLPEPEVFFDPPARCYYTRDSLGAFIPVAESALKRELKAAGFCAHTQEHELLSPLDRFLLKAQKERNVHYAGPLAGHAAGLMTCQGRRVLITESPTYLPAEEGPWPTWRMLLERLFSPPAELDPDGIESARQLATFYSWLKTGMTALRAGQRRPGQVLVLAGPPNCGKSLVQNFVTKLLGGRSAKPYQFLTGGTQFNGELFHAEHLMIEDEAAILDARVRVKMGTMLKGLVVNEDQRCHPKHRAALTLQPFWRLSITLNDDAESLMVLPPLDGIADKVILLRVYPGPMPMLTETLDQWKAFNAVLHAELPALVHFLLREWQVPRELKCDRFGATHYHQPDLVRMMSALAPETKLLELIDTRLFPPSATSWTTWRGKASELESELFSPNSGVVHEARKLLIYHTACGQYLSRLEDAHQDRISRRVLQGCTLWEIKPPRSLGG